MKKTLQDLQQTIWYRFVKVLYMLILLLTVVIVIAVYGNEDFSILTLYIFIALLVFEIIRRVFYYIVFGTFFPSQKTFLDKFQKNNNIDEIKYYEEKIRIFKENVSNKRVFFIIILLVITYNIDVDIPGVRGVISLLQGASILYLFINFLQLMFFRMKLSYWRMKK